MIQVKRTEPGSKRGHSALILENAIGTRYSQE